MTGIQARQVRSGLLRVLALKVRETELRALIEAYLDGLVKGADMSDSIEGRHADK